MTHPHRLHAAAALWNLRAALRHLATAAEQEAIDIGAELLEAADGLRSTTYGTRHASGGHSDPVGDRFDREPRVNRYAVLLRSTTSTLVWLADRLHIPTSGAPLDDLHHAIPALDPRLCATLCRWVDEADQRIRQALDLRPDLWLLPPTATCPACSVRLLYAQTAAPDTAAWTIVCGENCTCTGDTCPCGMPVRAAGVRHIWTADSDLARGAFAGDAPTQQQEAAA